jgi:hypothetical protein
MSAPFRRTSVLLLLLLTASLRAQGPAAHQMQQATRIPPVHTLQEMVSLSGSLEFVLVGVSGLTDAQRDTIERIEQQLRDTILTHATAMQRGRASRTAWSSAEQILFEREINAIVAARAQSLGRLRDVLMPEQQILLDRNALALRDWDVGYWRRYARGVFGLATLDPVTTP